MALDNELRSVPPGVPANLITPQGNMPAIGVPNSQDYARLIFSAPYFEQIPIAEIIQPSVTEAVENILPSLVPQYVDAAAQAAVQQLAVLLTGSTMSGPLFLSPLMPTQPSQAATMAYVDSMVATAGIPEVPPVPSGQVWARETGQWVPITPQTGVFLPLSGGSMTGNINMSGNTIQNMAAVPAMPNGAAPAQWVLNQIASVSLYQGTWNADNNVPDLTQLSTHVNAYTWIAITTAVDGVVIGPAIPGLQGMTVYNGDTIIYSTVQGQFMSIHAGGLTLPEADARYVQLAGSQMSGALLLNANASQPLQAVTYQQLQAFVPPGAVGEAPNDGQLYGRNGLTASWAPVLPLAGGILTGSLTLAGNATANLNPVPLQQMTSAISAATAGYLPLSGAAMTGLMTLSGNASVALNPVPLQQLTGMLGTYAPLQNPAFSGVPTAPTATPATTNTTQIASTAFVQSVVAGYLPLSGGTLTGTLNGTNIMLSGNLYAGGGNVVVGQAVATSPLLTESSARVLNIWSQDGSNLTTLNLLAATTSVNGNLGTAGTIAAANGSVTLVSSGIVYEGLGDSASVGFVWTGSALDYYVNGSLIGSISDATLKTNFAPVSVDPLGVVNRIALQQFDWVPRQIGDATYQPPHNSCGFTAQDLQALIPEAVLEGGEKLSVDVLPLMGYLIGAMQQLSARVSALDGKTA